MYPPRIAFANSGTSFVSYIEFEINLLLLLLLLVVVVIVIETISIVHSFLSPWYYQRGQNRREKEGNLSAKELRRIWKDELLPSIRREIKREILELKSSIKVLIERCNAIEKCRDFFPRNMTLP